MVGKEFTDEDMFVGDKGHWQGKKFIDDVYHPIGQQILIGYAPVIRQAARANVDAAKLDNASGFLTINDALVYFPDLQHDYRDSYDYYVQKNQF